MNGGTILFLDVIIASILFFIALHECKIVGWFGEHWVKQELKKLPKDRYRIINDVLLKRGDRTCQIDHVVVSPYGIFVIETKQYNGFFVGGKYDKKWTMYAGKRKYYYENPIRQNYGHCMIIKELLKLDDLNVFNIVCIPSNAKLKIKHDGELTRNTTIVKKILSYQKEVINNYEEVFFKLEELNIKDKNVRKQHIKNIKKSIV